MAERYIASCQWCGKKGSIVAMGTPSGGTPKSTPTVSGSCPSSPNGKHAPQWVLR